MPEAWLLSLALAAYATCAAVTVWGWRWQRPSWPVAGAALGAAIVLHAVSLGTRWQSLGHGPFTTLHEILSSNLWSLSLVVALSALWVRELRVALSAALLPLAVLAAWLLASDARPGHLPATYDTPLLYLHTLVGKLYLGLLLVAVALGAMPWLRRTRAGAALGVRAAEGFENDHPNFDLSESHRSGFLEGAKGSRTPEITTFCGVGLLPPRLLARGMAAERFDELAHRFAAFAFVFDTLMLIVGAVWAQDAWGRYWAWDPLESWAFASWVALAATLHARATLRPRPAVFGAMLAGVFVLAFLTFFGVPFLSTAPHKGAV